MRIALKVLAGLVTGVVVSGLGSVHGVILGAGHPVLQISGWLLGALFMVSVTLVAYRAATVWGWGLLCAGLGIWALPVSVRMLQGYAGGYQDPARRAWAEAVVSLGGAVVPGLVGLVCFLPGLLLVMRAVRAKWEEDALTEEAERLSEPGTDPRATLKRRLSR